MSFSAALAEFGDVKADNLSWNRVLNGAVRFDITPEAAVGGWQIVTSDKTSTPEEWKTPQPLTKHMRFDKGGVIVVFVKRLNDVALRGYGNHDLRGLMVHELGTALGGGNGSTLYTSRMQDCIDKDMAMSVGAVLNLPAAQLNWCETGATIAAK